MEPKIFNHLSDQDDDVLDHARAMPLVHGDQAAAHLPAESPAGDREPAK
ncbi:hypothetical protein [Microbacterium mangrovi]|nr:hypothetical protein [Microbacterium mangrovi]